MTRFAALGDSITVGMGDPAPGGGWRGWATLLAGTLPQPELHNLATLGALAADVERAQLPAAMALRPDVASVVVGINDTLRGDFDPERTGTSIGRTVAALRAAGAEVLTIRLPDPGQMFGLPGALARPLARRMRAVNAAVDEVARRYGTVHLDTARDPATYERRYWSVDRLHPNERGHRLIACRFHALLAAAEFPVAGPGPDPGAVQSAADQAGRGGLDGDQGHRVAGPAVPRPGSGPGGAGGARVARHRPRRTGTGKYGTEIYGTGRYGTRAREPERLKQAFRKLAASRLRTLGSAQGAEPILKS